MTAVLDKPEVEIAAVFIKTIQFEALVDVGMIAKFLGLNECHVRDRLVKRAEFPKGFKIGGALRWKLSEIQSWLEEQR